MNQNHFYLCVNVKSYDGGAASAFSALVVAIA